MDDREWMYEFRGVYFAKKLEEFCKAALKHQRSMNEDTIVCPCIDCKLGAKLSTISEVKVHVLTRGFVPNYKRWLFHGEPTTPMDCSSSRNVKKQTWTNTVVDDTTDIDCHVLSDSEMSNNTYDDDDHHDDQPEDLLEDMFHDIEDHFGERPVEYQRIIDASNTPLFPGCIKYTKLSAVLTLFNCKGNYGWSDKSFTALLELLHDMLPVLNDLPTSTYEAKKLMCPMGMEYQKIHACPNDCILYRGEYEHLDRCPKPECNASRYKIIEDEDENSNKCVKKGSPAKVVWYMPIIPRLKRMFGSEKMAKNMRWHAQGRKMDGKIRHPADGAQWRNINRMFYDHFGYEDRNVRLGLCTDGMNPYGTLSSQHSTWPVLLCVYNLPSWLCMKRKYIMLSLLISGPKQPGHNIDVYLAPLIDDLKLLWHEGEMVYDAYGKENFRMCAMLFCTMNDFSAYGNLSGYKVKGNFACPICEDETCTYRLENCCKNVYMCHRRLLPEDHPYRKRRKLFNGQVEKRVARPPLPPDEVYNRVKDIVNVFRNKSKQVHKGIWKKCSIFWQLEYWRYLPVRHCLDIMQIGKNVGEAVIGTLLNIPGKSKDGWNVRKDMEIMGILQELHPHENDKGTYLPPACYTLSKKEKISFCKSISSVKVPSGYSSNIASLISMKDLKLTNMKSHDTHVLLQHVLPVAIRGILPKDVRNTITRLCFFYNGICSKALDVDSLDALQRDIVVTVCQLEMFFPPSFFDIMIHLLVHIVYEIKQCGPVYLRYMYPFERYMGILKGRMKNKYRPEGSIIKNTILEEVTEFCTDYLKGVEAIGVPETRHQKNIEGKGVVGKIYKCVSSTLMNSAHLLVLNHIPEVEPYFEKHMMELKSKYPMRNHVWLQNEQNKSFCAWFKDYVMTRSSVNPGEFSEEIKLLAFGPGLNVYSYEGYDINGYTFYTQRQDDKSIHQNSGVKVEASSMEYVGDSSSPVSTSSSYYGVIQDIWELHYKSLKFPLFHFKWVDNKLGYHVDGVHKLVDLSREGHKEDPFVLAKDCEQIWFMKDPSNSKYYVILEGKRLANLDIEDTTDDERDDEEDGPPILSGLQKADYDDLNDLVYVRSDHNEGLWVDVTN